MRKNKFKFQKYSYLLVDIKIWIYFTYWHGEKKIILNLALLYLSDSELGILVTVLKINAQISLDP